MAGNRASDFGVEPTASGRRLLPSPFQMMGLETNLAFVAMPGDARWIDESSEKPTPSLNKSGQDPQCSYNDAGKQREHRTKARKIH